MADKKKGMLQRLWDSFYSHFYIYEEQGQNRGNYACMKVAQERSSAHGGTYRFKLI